MASLAELHQAVQKTIDSKRLGAPVFVRYTLQGTEKADELRAGLTRAATAVCAWMGHPLVEVYALGARENGVATITLRFRNGTSAQVSASRSPVRGEGVDLMVIGNHGALYHDAGDSNLWDEPAGEDAREDRQLRELIARALRSRKPERREEGQP